MEDVRTTAIANVSEKHIQEIVSKLVKIPGNNLDYSSVEFIKDVLWDYQKLSQRKKTDGKTSEVNEEEFDRDDLGLSLIHDRLREAVKAYEDYLVVYGTAPHMGLVEQLKKDVDKVLYHDGANVTPFRQTATGLIYPDRKVMSPELLKEMDSTVKGGVD